MYAIATPYGMVLKFDSIADLDDVVKHLSGMLEWADATLRDDPNADVKLAYATFPDDDGDGRKLFEAILASLPGIKHQEE